ncbi:jg22361 [Pararge aegeria aegeria]|uniref:Jg22361 protein n=1 Tax=Pararge aegeria aegeria TaxID=348720 RepID=A0A8S4SAN9_9NEOP|nr:jg22361 [Pararge aegeria aegeria]
MFSTARRVKSTNPNLASVVDCGIKPSHSERIPSSFLDGDLSLSSVINLALKEASERQSRRLMLFPSAEGEQAPVDTIVYLRRARRGVKVACDRDPLTPRLGRRRLRWVLVGILADVLPASESHIPWQGCLNEFPSEKKKKGSHHHILTMGPPSKFTVPKNTISFQSVLS